MNRIQLNDMELYAYHGVFEEEQKIGAYYRVNIQIDTDFMAAAEKDELAGTIDYVKVYELVKREMDKPAKLIEHVTYRIHQQIKQSFSEVRSIEVKVEKLNPPVHAPIGSVSVIIKE